MTAIVISLLPAFQQRERSLAGALRDEGRAMSGGVARQRGRRTLVVSEIALATIMATGAGLMVRSLLNARNVDPGFDPEHLAADHARPARLSLSRTRRRHALRARHDRAAARRFPRSPPRSASSSVTSLSVSIEGQSFAKVPRASGTLAFPGYFETMRIPMRAGEAFTDRETARVAARRHRQRDAGAPVLPRHQSDRQANQVGRPDVPEPVVHDRGRLRRREGRRARCAAGTRDLLPRAAIGKARRFRHHAQRGVRRPNTRRGDVGVRPDATGGESRGPRASDRRPARRRAKASRARWRVASSTRRCSAVSPCSRSCSRRPGSTD